MRFLRQWSFWMILTSFVFLAGCSTAQKRQQEAIKVGVHKIHDSLNKGRVDLAKKYSDELVQVVPKPKKLVPVKPIIVKYPDRAQPEQIVVLPPEYKEKRQVVVDTPEFAKIVEENKEIKKQLEVERKEFVKYQGQIDNAVKKVWEESQKEKKSSFWAWIWGLGFTGMILLVVGACLFPQFLPFAINWVKSVFSAFLSIFKKKPQ